MAVDTEMNSQKIYLKNANSLNSILPKKSSQNLKNQELDTEHQNSNGGKNMFRDKTQKTIELEMYNQKVITIDKKDPCHRCADPEIRKDPCHHYSDQEIEKDPCHHYLKIVTNGPENTEIGLTQLIMKGMSHKDQVIKDLGIPL